MQKNYSLAWCNPSNKQDNAATNQPCVPEVEDAALIKKALRQAALIKDQIIVIKLSEHVISDTDLLNNFAENIFLLKNAGARIIIVHEYENIVESKLKEISSASGIERSRFGKDKLSDLVEMIISGRINRDIITKLCEYSVQAIGISGKDNQSITSTKFDSSSSLSEKNIILINPETLMINDENDIVSVVSPITYDDVKKTIILDASLTASAIASAIGADHLIMMSDKNYFTENNLTISDLLEWQHVTTNNLNINLSSPEIKAVQSLFSHNGDGCLVHFCDATIQDSLLLKMFV